MLKIHTLSKRLGSNLVLNDLNMTVKKGSIYGLIGPNGAGKSTLLRCIAGIYKPDLGCVTIQDEKVYDNAALKSEIMLLSDDPYYFYQATIGDMKEFYKVWYPSLDEEVYHKYLEIFQLDPSKAINDFSKGMKRQAFIILALAIAPKLLLLDEAFDGLDPMMRLTFKKAIADMLEEKEMTVIISSHNLKEMEDICDSFGILDEGKIMTGGNMDEEKENLHKIQLAFRDEVDKELFHELDLLSCKITSRVVNLVVRGNIDKITNYLNSLNPLMMEVLNVSLDELFIYEMYEKGYGSYEKHV